MMLKAAQNWGVNEKVGDPDPRPPSGCALAVDRFQEYCLPNSNQSTAKYTLVKLFTHIIFI